MTARKLVSLLNSLFVLTCAGSALGAPVLSSVAVGPESSGMIAPGGSDTYAVTVSRVGSGNLDVYLSVSGLPAGVSASFSPAMVHFTGPTPTFLTATLRLSTPASIAMGTYNFTVIADDGASHNQKTSNGVLKIGVGVGAVQMLADHSVDVICCGWPGQTYLIQATTDLITPLWTDISTNTAGTNSIFSFIDSDAKTCPCRFYRTVEF